MKPDEFLRLIVSVRDEFDWTLRADTGRFSDRRATPRFRLEAVPKKEPGGRLDPIRALAYARTGELPDTWSEAAERLGVSLPDANALAAAADDRTWAGTQGERLPSPQRHRLRFLLLEAVGLMPPVPEEATEQTEYDVTRPQLPAGKRSSSLGTRRSDRAS